MIRVQLGHEKHNEDGGTVVLIMRRFHAEIAEKNEEKEEKGQGRAREVRLG